MKSPSVQTNTLHRPALTLTAPPLQAVRNSGDTAPTVHVVVDTLTFDRLLILTLCHIHAGMLLDEVPTHTR